MSELPEKIGRYEVLAVAGRGAMGVVYKARDPLINRTVAVKIVSLSAHLEEEQRREYALRFSREAQAAGNLHHPGIVTIFDVGEDGGLPYMAMEYVEGKSLSRYLKDRKALPLEEAVDIANQVAEALAYAHRQGVVHRDIKPDNILIDREGRAVITDFGVARLSSSELTRTGEVLGTPHFMSPEQVLGKAVDGRSDLFSLGVVLYVMLTGEKPFSGETVSSICYQIVHEAPRPLPAARGLPPEIADILGRLLAKDPDERFAGGSELAAALGVAVERTLPVDSGTRGMDGPTILGPPPAGSSQDTRKPAPGKKPQAESSPLSKKRLAWILATAGALVVIAAVVGFLLAGRLGFSLRRGTGDAASSGPLLEAGSNTPVKSVEPMRQPGEKVEAKATGARRAEPSPPRAPRQKQERPAAPAAEAPAGEVRSAPTAPKEETVRKPAPRVADARVGLIVEGPMTRGIFRVYVNGKLRLEEPLAGVEETSSPRRRGFRIVKHMKIPPGEYKLRFELVSPRPRLFYANGAYDLHAVPGGEKILKIEPRRFPARLKVTEIPLAGGKPSG